MGVRGVSRTQPAEMESVVADEAAEAAPAPAVGAAVETHRAKTENKKVAKRKNQADKKKAERQQPTKKKRQTTKLQPLPPPVQSCLGQVNTCLSTRVFISCLTTLCYNLSPRRMLHRMLHRMAHAATMRWMPCLRMS